MREDNRVWSHCGNEGALAMNPSNPSECDVLAGIPGMPTDDVPLRSGRHDSRRVVRMTGGELPEVVTAAEAALFDTGDHGVYQRGGLLVRVVRMESLTIRRGFRRPAGALVIVPLETANIVDLFTRATRFERSKGNDEWRPIDCPDRVAKVYLARRGEWRAPSLMGIIEAPTLRPDGSILERSGYDEATGLLYAPGETTFEAVPDHPTRDTALAALERLLELLDGFPFLEESDRSVALSAILSGLVRKSLNSAPLHAFTAPKARTGKTHLADLTSLFATGRPCAVMSQNVADETEEKKRLLATLLAGDPVVCIDNIEYPLKSPALCQALTQESITDRVLGFSRNATAPTNVLFQATGNNLRVEGDLTARTLLCRLDAGVERPEERRFDVNLYEAVPQQRPELVPAALTILRAYHVAGRPRQALPPWGGFDEWSDWVRSSLVWLGRADPALTRRVVEQSDPVRQGLCSLLTAWKQAFGTRVVGAGEVVSETSSNEALRAVLRDVAGNNRGEISTRRLGHYLAKHADRIEGGLVVRRAGEYQGSAQWKVEVWSPPT